MVSTKAKIYGLIAIGFIGLIVGFIYRGEKIKTLQFNLKCTKEELSSTQNQLEDKMKANEQYIIDNNKIQSQVNDLNRKLKEVQDDDNNQAWLKAPIPAAVDNTIPY